MLVNVLINLVCHWQSHSAIDSLSFPSDGKPNHMASRTSRGRCLWAVWWWQCMAGLSALLWVLWFMTSEDLPGLCSLLRVTQGQ